MRSLLLLACFTASFSGGQSPKAPPSIPLKRFLQDYLPHSALPRDSTTRFIVREARLAGNSKAEFVVYLSGRDWCGSGGCRLLVLESQGSAYRVIGDSTIVKLPVRVLRTSTHGYRDLSVRVQGGGILHEHEALLPFNGKNYPGNPSMPPARKLIRPTAGATLMTGDEQDQPLYDAPTPAL